MNEHRLPDYLDTSFKTTRPLGSHLYEVTTNKSAKGRFLKLTIIKIIVKNGL